MASPLSHESGSAPRFPPRSAMAALAYELDWEQTALGPMESWPQRLKLAFEMALASRQPMVILWGPDLRLLYNDAYTQILGKKHPYAFGQPCREVWAEIWELLDAMFAAVRETGEPIWHENLRLEVLRNGSPEECYFTFSGGPLFGDEGGVDGIVVSAVETTSNILRARRLRVLRDIALAALDVPDVEEGLRRCTLPLAADPNDVPFSGVYLASPDRRTLRWVAGHGLLADAEAPPVLPADGPLGEALRGHPVIAPWRPAEDSEAEAMYLPLRHGREPVGVLVAGLHPLRPFVAPYQDFFASVAAQLSAMISRSATVERLDRQRRHLLERMTDGFYAFDREWRCVHVNDAAARMMGKRREELIGRSLSELFPAARGSRFERESHRALREQVPVHLEERALDGKWVDIHAHPTQEGLSVFVRDITERRRAEEHQRQLLEVLEATPDFVGMADPAGHILFFNRSGRRMLGYPEDAPFVGSHIRMLVTPEMMEQVMRPAIETAIREGSWRGESRLLHRDGHEVPVSQVIVAHRSASGELAFLSTIAFDQTSQQQVEAQLRQAQKMEAIGQLAGGIAHDFNNLLSVIGTYARFALEEVTPGTELHEDLEEINDSVERGAALTRQLLAFSRKQSLSPEPVELSEVVSTMEKMFRRVLRSDITLVTSLAKPLDLVRADRGQLEQALLNLVINARDAMPDGGTLTLETGPAEGDERFARLVVRDTGIGMDESTLQRIFEPFFTTKPAGVGTGLGLSMVYGVVRQLGGTIDVVSAPGQGTAVTLKLPWSTEGVGGAQHALDDDNVNLRGTETLLVVEDDRAVRQSVRRLLQRQGYRVLEAGNGEEALALLEQRHADVQLVVADVVMPAMGGRELARRVRARWPELRLLFLSGYDPEGAAVPGEVVVQKPLVRDQLLRCVRHALSGNGQGGVVQHP